MGKLKRNTHFLSLKYSYILYMIVSLIIATAVGLGAMLLIHATRKYVEDNYGSNTYFYDVPANAEVITNYTPKGIEYIVQRYDTKEIIKIFQPIPNIYILTNTNESNKIISLQITKIANANYQSFSIALNSIFIGCIPVAFIIGSIVCSLIYFNRKLKQPLQILSTASNQISQNKLNFTIQYPINNEMGQLCNSFEKMRAALYENNQEIWRQMEERKRLNSAFSHDLRTPLTILKGYTELLEESVQNDFFDKQTVIENIKTMQNHIKRLENYTYEMSRIQKLADITIQRVKTDKDNLMEKLKDILSILGHDFQIEWIDNCSLNTLNLDAEIVMQVYENLISNAIRYAKSKIIVECKTSNNQFQITVTDDGDGFSEKDLELATSPFYKGKENIYDSHLGLGLHICKILTEKHNGNIILSNAENKGAMVTVCFGC